MRRWIGIALAPLIVIAAATAARPVVNRGVLADLEKRFDRRIERFNIDDPFYLLGNTRGVYLEDYGAVFTTELNLVAAAVVTPFRPSFPPAQVERVRRKKASRLEPLKKMMQDMMVDSATALKTVPADQQIVVGVSLFYYAWEDTKELPDQIVMQARRQTLLDFEAGRIRADGLKTAVRIQEF